MKSIKECKDLKGKTVILRADYNVPIDGNKIRDTFRIDSSLETIEFLRKKGSKIIIIAHLGEDGTQSLSTVAQYLSKKIPLVFIPTTDIASIQELSLKMKPKDVLLLENIRQLKGEKENDVKLAKSFSKLADVYVNDAFSVSHRNHMSLVGIPKYLPSYAGFKMVEEVKTLSKVLEPKHPFVFILGGAKFDTKMPLIKMFIKKADHLIIGGALLNNFLKEQGFEVGKSLIDENCPNLSKLITNPKMLLPTFVVVKRGEQVIEVSVADVLKNDVIIDVGLKSVKEFSPFLAKSKLIVWNGPLGLYEQGATKSTKALFKEIDKTKAEIIIGGGDTATLANKNAFTTKNIFISTGGGAAIDFLSKGTLPGIKVLSK